MKALALITAMLLTVMPVTDTGTGTPTEYEYTVPCVTEVEQQTEATEAQTEPTEAALTDNMDEQGYLSKVTWREIEMLACLVDREIGSGTLIEKQAVVWCVLNRLDKGSANGFKDTLTGVLTQSGQFYSTYGTGSAESINIVVDVLTLWMMEQQSGYPIFERVLPCDFCWYYGDGKHNHFRNCYKGGTEWDWSWTGGY